MPTDNHRDLLKQGNIGSLNSRLHCGCIDARKLNRTGPIMSELPVMPSPKNREEGGNGVTSRHGMLSMGQTGQKMVAEVSQPFIREL